MKKALTLMLVLCATAAFSLDLGGIKSAAKDKAKENASVDATDVAMKELTKKLKNVQAQKGLIVFKSGSAEIDTVKSKVVLQAIHQIIVAAPGFKVQIEGHTDSVGDPKANMKLSEKRAEAVKKYIEDVCKTPSNRLKAKGFGDTVPVADNKTPAGQAKNRRVDFSVTKI
ncbi:MAG TPA: OmpA family protein [Spirochaetota bacterium]|nr:OmpA family protein [Spirochaetota bacterium]HPC41202.1 OmpA family protein [Spirochaetota bacterium]HPL17477.1 OmpA family protein [Spirochaetota bacterium]HQF08186.1 OmpA family protein [Spirochaetota bacterium]HQH96927.1 OmpA family protein [Spirochaetota bacterium]